MTVVFLLSRKNEILILLKINDKIYFVAYKVMSVTFWENGYEALYRRKKHFCHHVKKLLSTIVHITDSA